jgi:hypothetical protein
MKAIRRPPSDKPLREATILRMSDDFDQMERLSAGFFFPILREHGASGRVRA